LYARELSKSERAKQDKFLSLYNTASAGCCSESRRLQYLEPILESLTPDDVRFLIRAEDELAQAAHFTRIFPTRDTHKYFKYFDTPRYYNLLFDAWETKYADDNLRAAAIDRLERLCVSKYHLKVPTIISKANGTTPAAPLASASGKGGGRESDAKDTARVSRPTGKKKVVADVSMLKGPTGTSAASFKTADDCCPIPLPPPPSSPTPSPTSSAPSAAVKVKAISVTAKPHSISHSKSSASVRKSPSASSSSNRKSVNTSPEPMSTDMDTPLTSASDKSRSPSPPGSGDMSPADSTSQAPKNDNEQGVDNNQVTQHHSSNNSQILDNQTTEVVDNNTKTMT